MHNPHPDTHQHGFDDECARCQQYIANPTEVDAENLRRIWSGSIITQTDLAVYNVLYRSVVVTQKLVEAFQWEAFDSFLPGEDFGERVSAFEPAPRLDAFTLFEVGGRS